MSKYALALLLVALPMMADVVPPGTIPHSTKIKVRLDESVYSASAKPGGSVQLSIAEDVHIDGVLLIPRGTTVEGGLIQVFRDPKKSKLGLLVQNIMMPDGGKIPIQNLKIYVEGKNIALAEGATYVGFTNGEYLVKNVQKPDPSGGLLVEAKSSPGAALAAAAVEATRVAPKPAAKSPEPQKEAAKPSAKPVETARISPPPAESRAAAPRKPDAKAEGKGDPNTPRLKVSSNPPGAEVTLDDTYFGTTPGPIVLQPAGIYRVTIKMAGYKVWEQTVDLRAGDTININAKLVPQTDEVASR